MGQASAKAQGLCGAITSGRKLELSDHSLYILQDEYNSCKVLGMLKVGMKRLFVYDRHSQQWEMEPLCVLDFYVHESHQRMGYGKKLFAFMLKNQSYIGNIKKTVGLEGTTFFCKIWSLLLISISLHTQNDAEKNSLIVISPAADIQIRDRAPSARLMHSRTNLQQQPSVYSRRQSALLVSNRMDERNCPNNITPLLRCGKLGATSGDGHRTTCNVASEDFTHKPPTNNRHDGRSEAPISCPENRHRNAPALCLERRQVSDRTGHHSNPPLTDVDKRHDRSASSDRSVAPLWESGTANVSSVAPNHRRFNTHLPHQRNSGTSWTVLGVLRKQRQVNAGRAQLTRLW